VLHPSKRSLKLKLHHSIHPFPPSSIYLNANQEHEKDQSYVSNHVNSDDAGRREELAHVPWDATHHCGPKDDACDHFCYHLWLCGGV
jgi:hypothetical protein